MKEKNKPFPAKGINKLARIVISENKDTQVEFGKTHHISSSSPLPMRAYTGNPEDNLTGKKVGRFQVIGLFAFKPNKKRRFRRGLKWVVKCSCGRYEVMTHKGINHVLKYGSKYESKCQVCRKTEILKRNLENDEREN